MGSSPGKIREKYPADLPLRHNILSYQLLCSKQEIDKRRFGIAVQNALMYEGSDGSFIFTVPKTPEEMYDEATQQANCLASYVDRVIEGECIILFMRDKRTPNLSFVTAEIVNGKINQAKLARNAEPAATVRLALEKWVERCNSTVTVVDAIA